MIELLILILVLGVIAWIVTAIPMPQPFKVAAYGVMVIILIIYLAALLGHPVVLPR